MPLQMAAYREQFWVFVGTTGPIIALASVLTFGQATDAWHYLRKEDKESKGSRFWRLMRLSHIYFVVLSFALSLTLTILAAYSLWQRTNAINGPWVIALIFVTFVLVFILGACTASFKRRQKRAEASQS
jgi:ABC-type glycerol-3-phosphate transport system permease component